nr:unnamed protein product [Digitaria exilis]
MASSLFLLRRTAGALRRKTPRSRPFIPSSDVGRLASSRGTLERLAPPPCSPSLSTEMLRPSVGCKVIIFKPTIALDKSKYKEKLRAVRRYIPRLEQELEDLHAQMKLTRLAGENKGEGVGRYVASSSHNASSLEARKKSPTSVRSKNVADLLSESVEESKRLEDESSEVEDGSASESISFSESEDLSDIFESESEEEEDNKDRPLYLDRLDKFPSENNDNEPDDFEEHLRKIASLSDKTDSPSKELKVSELDEIDKIFLRASSLLKKR